MLPNFICKPLGWRQGLPRTVRAFARAKTTSSRTLPELRPFDRFDVRNKVIVVTGGARGLGLEIADQLYDAGAHGE